MLFLGDRGFYVFWILDWFECYREDLDKSQDFAWGEEFSNLLILPDNFVQLIIQLNKKISEI